MIVLAIIGVMVTFGARNLVTSSSKIKSAVRIFAGKIKKLRNRARIDNVTYRLVFDMPSDKDKPHRFWVESSSSTQAKLMTSEELEQEKDALEEADEKGDPQGFKLEGKIENLPKGLFFESVELAGDDDDIDSGRAFIFIFPQGYVQESAIHLHNRDKLHWTLVVHPLTGKTDVITKEVRLEDLIEK